MHTQPYGERHEGDDISANAAKTIREQFWDEFAIADDAHAVADISAGFGARASAQVLIILGGVPADPVAADAFSRASRTLVDWWDADRDRSYERDFEAEAAVSKQLQRFVMRAAPTTALQVLRPLLDAVDRHPEETYRIVEGLTAIEDGTPNTEQYWYLWSLFADRVKRATWIARLDEDRPVGREMLSAIFLTSWWRDDVRHWKSLDGHADKVHALFDQLPPSAIVLDKYLRFLYHIGEKSLPDAFLRISDVVRRGDALTILSRANAVVLLEVLLQRYVYGRPLELKHDATMRQAVLHLLDVLVEKGSSAAFRMRDDFVTPLA